MLLAVISESIVESTGLTVTLLNPTTGDSGIITCVEVVGVMTVWSKTGAGTATLTSTCPKPLYPWSAVITWVSFWVIVIFLFWLWISEGTATVTEPSLKTLPSEGLIL